jgi:glutathione S-transferase
MAPVQLFGRRSSHFTRVTRIFAEELGVPYEIVPIYDMKQREPGPYSDNPALKLPTLRIGDDVIFGTENICRTLAEHAGWASGIVWPEQLSTALQRNAQELVWHCMAAQVQIVVGTLVGKLPSDNIYFQKALAGFDGALGWLDTHVEQVVASLPPSRKLSLFETTLFCLIEHLHFRQTLPVDRYSGLAKLAATFATRPSALRTPYEIDVRPN